MNKIFNPINYWHRQHQRNDLTSVGYVGIGLAFNKWMYKVREKVFNRVVEEQKIIVSNVKILDIGSGSGFYPMLWKSLGAKDITASDFSLKALKNIPEIKIQKLDITKPLQNDLKKYDIVSAFDMLFHIIDDNAYHRAIGNIARLLKPGGIFIFSENLMPEKEYRVKHQVCRRQKDVLKILKENGFEIKKIQPVFFLMNNPIRSGNPLNRAYWFALTAILTRADFLGHFFGPILYPLELRLSQSFPRGPSTEIIVCKKTLIKFLVLR